MPLAVKFNSLCLAPPPSPHPSFSTGDFFFFFFGALLISPHSPTRKEAPAGRHPQSTWRALCGAVHVVVIGTTRSLDTVPDWLNYRWYTPLAPSVRACVLALGDTGPQMSLILLRMSLISVVTPSGRLQHLTRCERTKLVLDTQVEKKCFCKSLAQYFDYFNTFFFFCLVCASRFRYGEDAVPSIQTYKRYT